MIIPLDPSLEGLAERRFFSVARQVLAGQSDGDSARIGAIVEDEARHAHTRPELNGQVERYAACVRVLGDLAQLRWTFIESGYGLELHSPRAVLSRLQVLAPDQFEATQLRTVQRAVKAWRAQSARALILNGAGMLTITQPVDLMDDAWASPTAPQAPPPPPPAALNGTGKPPNRLSGDSGFAG